MYIQVHNDNNTNNKNCNNKIIGKDTSTTPSCSGAPPTHKIKRHLVPGVVYASSSHLRLFKEYHVYVFEQPPA